MSLARYRVGLVDAPLCMCVCGVWHLASVPESVSQPYKNLPSNQFPPILRVSAKYEHFLALRKYLGDLSLMLIVYTVEYINIIKFII